MFHILQISNFLNFWVASLYKVGGGAELLALEPPPRPGVGGFKG